MTDEGISVAELMRRTFAGADEAFAGWLKRSGRTPSCARGCSACCELLALITWPEALILAEDLQARGLVARFAPALAAQAERASFEGIDQRGYFDARIPCALLEPDRTCAVYEARPGPCRYHVAFSPLVLCNDRTPGTEIIQSDSAQVIRTVVVPILADLTKRGVAEAYEAAPIPVMVLAALRELGEAVPASIAPAEWLRRYGARVWGYQRKNSAAARREGGK